jgi:DNA-binding LacI/PurR family transcriptional regulator
VSPPRNVNIRDVARLAGVSPTTVSHALSGGRPVSAATRRRVHDAAERLGYRPHPGARSLKASGTGVLALCAVNVTSLGASFADLEYYFKLIKGVTEGTYGSEFALVVIPESQSGVYWDRLLLDGAIIADPGAADPNIRVLRARQVPYVTIGRDPDAPDEGCWVDGDAEAATRLFLDHLAAQGARDIAAVTWMTSDYWTQASVSAYHAWCEEHRQRPRLEVVPEDSDAALRETASRLLAPGSRPDAVYGVYELPAIAVLRRAAELGIDVPGDIMIAAPSDFGLGAASSPPLTTLDYHPEEHGREAAKMLIQLARGGVPPEPHKLLPFTLIERASTRRH